MIQTQADGTVVGGRSVPHFRDGWTTACERLVAAVPQQQRSTVQRLLSNPHFGGRGIRLWVQNLMRSESTEFPESIPECIVQVYLDDAEAIPLYDCEDCGVSLPVRPCRAGEDAEPDRVYFPQCPICGGHTGLYAFWSRPQDSRASRAELTNSDAERVERVRRIAR